MAKYDIEKCVKVEGAPLWFAELQLENAEFSFEKMFRLCLSLNSNDFLRICEVNEDDNVDLRIERRNVGWWYINIWVAEKYKGDYLVDCSGLENFLNDIFVIRKVGKLTKLD